MTRERRKVGGDQRGGWLGIIVLLLVLVVGALFVYGSELLGSEERYNLVVAGPGTLSFVSVDPVEERVFVLPYPANLHISSRSVGEYEVGKLYTLGQYDAQAGEFARQKTQGFMKVLVSGYLEEQEGREISKGRLIRRLLWASYMGSRMSNIHRADAVILALRILRYDWNQVTPEEIARGDLWKVQGEKLIYNPLRLQEYLEGKVFDWGIGQAQVTAAVINESGEQGLASDVAQFLANSGVDVIAVRNGAAEREQTEITVGSEELYAQIGEWLTRFGWGEPIIGDTSEYRSTIVVKIGKDGLKLF